MSNISTFYVDNYVNQENPICREERQYALFLYNKLLEKDKCIQNSLNLKGEIDSVFFEATILRDYWYWNKEEFNKILRKFIEDKLEFKCEFDNIKQHIRWWKKCHPYARWMMHAKPDIAIISHNQGKYFLNFIECKYFSGISIYKDSSGEFDNLNQIQLQELILYFICDHMQLKFSDERLNIGEVIQVQFISDIYSPKVKNGISQIAVKCILPELFLKKGIDYPE